MRGLRGIALFWEGFDVVGILLSNSTWFCILGISVKLATSGEEVLGREERLVLEASRIPPTTAACLCLALDSS